MQSHQSVVSLTSAAAVRLLLMKLAPMTLADLLVGSLVVVVVAAAVITCLPCRRLYTHTQSFIHRKSVAKNKKNIDTTEK